MIYKNFQDLKLSALGMGCMRLPVVNGDSSQIDQEATEEMVAYAMANGINYYDTAWGYHGGNSEIAIGKALAKYPRDRFCLADKFPGYDRSTLCKVEEIFETQLKKCQTDYFDFYLFHNVCESNVDAFLDPQYGILDYLLRQKAAGRIRHLGFSCHGQIPVLRRFLEECGQYLEFCQLQLNYVDWIFQNAKEKVELLGQHGIPVWVMEPLRGGRLVQLTEQEAAPLRALRPNETVPAWAFRFLQTIPNVVMTLSGMSSLTQMKENVETFRTEAPLNEEEWKALLDFGQHISGFSSMPCTGCRYCVSYCPQGLDIPRLLSLYNEFRFTGGGVMVPLTLSSLPEEKKPSACVGCRSCEAVCPQQLKISEAMADFCAKLS